MDLLCKQIEDYCSSTQTVFDAVVPVLRSGAIPGIILAVKLKVLRILPLQLKYKYETGKLDQLLELQQVKLPKKAKLLICENYTYSANTAQAAIKISHAKYPDAKLYYATVAKVVYGGDDELPFIKRYFYGVLTNEMFKLIDGQAATKQIRQKITIFPWEDTDAELVDINSA